MSPHYETSECYYGGGGQSCAAGRGNIATGNATASGLALPLHAKIEEGWNSTAGAGSYTDALTINVMF